MTERPDETTLTRIERKWELDRKINVSTLVAVITLIVALVGGAFAAIYQGSAWVAKINQGQDKIADLVILTANLDARLDDIQAQNDVTLGVTLAVRDENRASAAEALRLTKELRHEFAKTPSGQPVGVRLRHACDQLLSAGRDVSRLAQCR